MEFTRRARRNPEADRLHQSSAVDALPIALQAHYPAGMRIHSPAILLATTLLSACGGGGDGGNSAPILAPTPTPSKVTLAPNNYQNAVKLPMDVSRAAYLYSRLGVDVVDRWVNTPLPSLPVIGCPGGGTMSIELTDRNADRTLDPLDTAHFHWDRCRVDDITATGVVRVEFREGTAVGSSRDYLLTVTVADLKIERDGQPSTTVNFVAQVHYVHTDTSDRLDISNAVFDSGQVVGDTGTSTVAIDYRQDAATQTYQYLVSGTASSGALGGEVQFSTPTPFSGVIGEYPSAGRLQVLGNSNSGARLAEEGVAAGNVATVMVDLDSNGDGTADASDPQLAWVEVIPVQLFAAYPDQVAISIPMP